MLSHSLLLLWVRLSLPSSFFIVMKKSWRPGLLDLSLKTQWLEVGSFASQSACLFPFWTLFLSVELLLFWVSRGAFPLLLTTRWWCMVDRGWVALDVLFWGRDVSVLTHVCCLIECPVDNREQIMLAVWCSAKAAYLDIFPKLKAPVLDNYSRPRDGSLLMFFCGREVSVLTDVCCLIECPANNHEQLC